MIMWARVDPLEFFTVHDFVDHLFINYTESERMNELYIYFATIFVPFFVQALIQNDCTNPDYDTTVNGYVIIGMNLVLLLGQANNLFSEYNTFKTHTFLRNYFTDKTILSLTAILFQFVYAIFRMQYPWGTRLYTE